MTLTTTREALKGVFPAGNDQYHGYVSIARHGEVEHGAALAQVFLREGVVHEASEALYLASLELRISKKRAEGFQFHHEARKLIETNNRQATDDWPEANIPLVGA